MAQTITSPCLDLDEFREKVLESAHGRPGQIIEMCRLATQPQYLAGRYVKFAPLRIDKLIKFAGLVLTL